MKITIAVTSVSMLFLMIACEKSQEIAPTSTPTSVQTSSSGGVINSVRPTSKEIYDAFVRLALKNSSNTKALTIRKWISTKTQIKVYWDGGRTADLILALDKVIADMNVLNKHSKLVRTGVVAEADITINRVDAKTHNAKYTGFQVTNTSVQGNTFTQWNSTTIVKAVIWLLPTTPTTLQNGVLRHELTHALGLGHIENTKSIMVAVMNGANYDFNNFSILDQRVLQILGDNRVKQGMTEANASAVIKEYAAK